MIGGYNIYETIYSPIKKNVKKYKFSEENIKILKKQLKEIE